MIPYDKIVGTVRVPMHRFYEIFERPGFPNLFETIRPEALELLGPPDTWSWGYVFINNERFASFAFTNEENCIIFKLKYA